MKKGLITDTFVCANTAEGFYSMQNEIFDSDYVYIIKGGPGTGKSSFMKKAAEKMRLAGYDTELIHCSSDPDSLDGVYSPSLSLTLFDGTPPHMAEPPYPGAAGGLINIGECWNADILEKNVEKIKELNLKGAARYK